SSGAGSARSSSSMARPAPGCSSTAARMRLVILRLRPETFVTLAKMSQRPAAYERRESGVKRPAMCLGRQAFDAKLFVPVWRVDMTDEFATYPSLRGRVAFVSGGASGLGEEFVRQLAGQGAR